MIRTIVVDVEILGPGPSKAIEVADGETWARAVLRFDELEGEHVLDILVSPNLRPGEAPHFTKRRFHMPSGDEASIRSSIAAHLGRVRGSTKEDLFSELDQLGFDAS